MYFLKWYNLLITVVILIKDIIKAVHNKWGYNCKFYVTEEKINSMEL